MRLVLRRKGETEEASGWRLLRRTAEPNLLKTAALKAYSLSSVSCYNDLMP
jgi:hypothetical protein